MVFRWILAALTGILAFESDAEIQGIDQTARRAQPGGLRIDDLEQVQLRIQQGEKPADALNEMIQNRAKRLHRLENTFKHAGADLQSWKRASLSFIPTKDLAMIQSQISQFSRDLQNAKDEVEIQTPEGMLKYKILKIH